MEIWVHRNGQYAGRFSESAIREKVADGSLSAADLAWDETKSAWKPISEFLAAFPAAKPDPVPSLSSSSASSESKPEAASDAARRAAATEEEKPAESARATPPPLPTMPMPAPGPPPLPSVLPMATP